MHVVISHNAANKQMPTAGITFGTGDWDETIGVVTVRVVNYDVKPKQWLHSRVLLLSKGGKSWKVKSPMWIQAKRKPVQDMHCA